MYLTGTPQKEFMHSSGSPIFATSQEDTYCVSSVGQHLVAGGPYYTEVIQEEECVRAKALQLYLTFQPHGL